MSVVDFLDVTLNLDTGLHSPYMKPNNTIQYVHTSSNHPRHIIDNIPKAVEKRLSLMRTYLIRPFNLTKNPSDNQDMSIP